MSVNDNISIEMHCLFCREKYFVDFSHRACIADSIPRDNQTKFNHDVRSDYYLANLFYRLTCYSIGCYNATLIKHPSLTEKEWEINFEQFKAEHPTDEIIDEGF